MSELWVNLNEALEFYTASPNDDDFDKDWIRSIRRYLKSVAVEMPTVEPPRGSWINTTLEWVDDVKFVLAKCSECGNGAVMDMEQLNDTIKFARNFCPSCGAHMRVEQPRSKENRT